MDEWNKNDLLPSIDVKLQPKHFQEKTIETFKALVVMMTNVFSTILTTFEGYFASKSL